MLYDSVENIPIFLLLLFSAGNLFPVSEWCMDYYHPAAFCAYDPTLRWICTVFTWALSIANNFQSHALDYNYFLVDQCWSRNDMDCG